MYCGGRSAQGEHVFARQFFLASDRDNLPKVPACASCNRAKSDLERYAMSILPFGGRHPSATEYLQTLVPKRLAKNAPLSRSLFEHQGRVWQMDRSDLALPHMTLPVDYQRLVALYRFIARGLLWHHWQVLLSETDAVSVIMLNEAYERVFDVFLRSPDQDVIRVDLGNGTVYYEGAQGVDCPQLSMWRIRMFGGVQLADSSGSTGTSSVVGLVTGPRVTLISGGWPAVGT